MKTSFNLTQMGCDILQDPNPASKATKTLQYADQFRIGCSFGSGNRPLRPSRPERPCLVPPNQVPQRKGKAGIPQLLHALAHIELNALDMSWHTLLMGIEFGMPSSFFDDWIVVAEQEAQHFLGLNRRLLRHHSHYGAYSAHDGLWEATMVSNDCMLARLVIVPLVLEARGLDVTPTIMAKLRKFGDTASLAHLQIIYHEEVGHVGYGVKWYRYLCNQKGLKPEKTFLDIIQNRFTGRLKLPFNHEARAKAGLPQHFYDQPALLSS